jgi:SAM-dependent methyltransferase
MPDPDFVRDRINAFWSMVAPAYESHPGNVVEPGTEVYAAWVGSIQQALPPQPADVLDVGTGTGFVALIAASLGHRVTGIDLSDEMLAEARAAAANRGVSVVFASGDAVSPPFPAPSFDAITSRHLLWTLRDADAAFRNWRELLRTGGRLIAFDSFWSLPGSAREEPAGEEQAEGIFEQHYSREVRANLPGWRFKSPEPLVQMLRHAGFEDVDISQQPALHDPAGEDTVPFLLTAIRR